MPKSWAIDSSPRTRSTACHSRSGTGDSFSALRDEGMEVVYTGIRQTPLQTLHSRIVQADTFTVQQAHRIRPAQGLNGRGHHSWIVEWTVNGL